MRREVSASIGIIGGLTDIVAGLAILQSPSSMEARPMMMYGPAVLAGYFLTTLGVAVLLTGLYLFKVRIMQKMPVFGWLMVAYGVIMLVVGSSMLGQMFPMMQGSLLSGTAMMIVGVAMLYSGYEMIRK